MKSTGAGGRGGVQLHVHLVGQPVPLAQVAGRARGHDVLPDRAAALRARNHVVEVRRPWRCRSRRSASRHARKRAPRDLALDHPGNPDIVRGRITCGHGNLPVAEQSGRSSSSTTSAFPLKSRTWARLTEHTLSGSKLAFRTRTCCTLRRNVPTRAGHRPSRARRPRAPRARGPRRASRGRLLHVDPGVIAALDRRDDEPRAASRRAARPRRIGGRRCPRRRRSGRSRCSRPCRRSAGRGAPGRRDLVDAAVQVVDPALERDRELDEILAAAAHQHPLRLAQALDATQETQASASRRAEEDADDGDGQRDVRGDVHRG